MATTVSPDGRYSRQELFRGVGPEGQARIRRARVLLVGCGALGSHLAESLVRAGIGRLTIVDRDFVEWSNLPRQALFDEADAAAGLPKAEAAARRLRAINSEAEIDARVVDFDPRIAEREAEGCDLILDGTDNLETRYLINDVAVKAGIPWIYGGVVGTSGLVMPVFPGAGPCLTCLFPNPPGPGELPTCDTVGVLGPAVSVVAAFQAIEAIRHLTGATGEPRGLVQFDLWTDQFTRVAVPRDPDCPTCVKREFHYLNGQRTQWATSLCGRCAVQIVPGEPVAVDLARLAQVAGPGTWRDTGYYLRLEVEGMQLTLFPDGRAIVAGTTDPAVARGVYARYVGC